MKSNLEEILKEQKFPCMGMDAQNRDNCLEIVSMCKDISDSDQKIANQSKCRLVEMHLNKEGNEINANGSVFIGTLEEKEYRHVDANIYVESESIIVDMLITRLLYKGEKSQYRTLDEFTIDNDKLIRTSQYNYDMKSIVSEMSEEDKKIVMEFISNCNKKGRKK